MAAYILTSLVYAFFWISSTYFMGIFSGLSQQHFRKKYTLLIIDVSFFPGRIFYFFDLDCLPLGPGLPAFWLQVFYVFWPRTFCLSVRISCLFGSRPSSFFSSGLCFLKHGPALWIIFLSFQAMALLFGFSFSDQILILHCFYYSLSKTYFLCYTLSDLYMISNYAFHTS